MNEPVALKRRRFRILTPVSVRGLMVVVLIVGAGLGWLVYRVRVQREALAAIVRAGGRVAYDWELSDVPFRASPSSKPSWPAWLVRLLGPDYFGNVVSASIGSRDYDTVMPQVGRLDRLIELNISRKPLPNPGLAHLRGLTRLNRLWLRPGDNPGGAALENLQGLMSLQELVLLEVTDADLAHIKVPAELRVLSLTGKNVTDAGVAHLKDFVGLRELTLQGAPVSSTGLAYLRGMSRLERLRLFETRVDDLSPIEHLNGLLLLSVTDAPLGDAGLAPASRLTGLRELWLAGTTVSDAGLTAVEELTELGAINVSGTQVTDDGLMHLHRLGKLQEFFAQGTKVTDEGLAQLKTVLPSLKKTVSGRFRQPLRPR